MGHSRKARPAGRRGRRRRTAPRRGRTSTVTTVTSVALVAAAAVAVSAYRNPLAASSRPASAPSHIHRSTASPGRPGPGATTAQASPNVSATATRPAPSASSSTISIPAKGPGVFTTAPAAGRRVGAGATVRRYRVEVEDGIALSAQQAAHEIAGILADPRGWTADGIDSFQLTGSGPYDFAVKIATPGTVDAICGAAGLDTGGEVNCDVGEDVVVNLKRWVLGSPKFDGPLHEYHALIINHEVGHRIGHGHETCPGPGRPAPVMMQQIKGLKGCIANAWPYDSRGRYLSGPAAP
ncbi:DUF3152 domain-containing protein [Streptomyces sp. MK7]|uniref:DUF3152 domain-containing protein n=1 Tax=Streptomyces sp. MK7 TaxID=3067635 RepID=UPI00292EF812|nr:DUF3152 domain-containing protein [Streptomyces sp. MK7]